MVLFYASFLALSTRSLDCQPPNFPPLRGKACPEVQITKKKITKNSNYIDQAGAELGQAQPKLGLYLWTIG